MLIPLEQARALLGAEADNLSDEAVARLCREAEDYARLIVRRFDQVTTELRVSDRVEASTMEQGAA